MAKENLIAVLNGAVRLHQASNGFRTSMDAVIIAAACPAKAGDHILDLGCGVGSAGLCVLHRVPGIHLTGLDIQADHIDLARQNAEMNNEGKNTDFITGDIRGFKGGKFSHIICNPPYGEAGQFTHSDKPSRNKALMHEDKDITIADWVKCAFNNVKSGGSLTIIHRADALPGIILALGKSFGRTEIIPLHTKAGQPATRVIVRALKHRKSPAILHPGVMLHNEDGTPSVISEDVLRGGKGLYL